MLPLVRVPYSGLTRSVIKLDKEKFSSYDCPEKIPVDMEWHASCFTSFGSGSRSIEIVEFYLTLRLVYFIAQAIASTCSLSVISNMPCINFSQKVVCFSSLQRLP
jgi:hypothetical protein